MGAGLGLALSASGHHVTLLVRTERPTPDGVGRSVAMDQWRTSLGAASVVMIAVPDGAIAQVAASVAELGVIGDRHVVLHLSGLLDRGVLGALTASGAALGSMHPLQAIAAPQTAAARLRGSFAAVEGDPRAIEAGTLLARAVGMTPVVIPSDAKPAYHAAAAIASNYTVALAEMARRVAEAGGVPPAMAQVMYLPLMRGTVDNIAEQGTAAALTGAIRRGDAGTVAAHLSALAAEDRALYVLLGMEALRLARIAGLAEEPASRVETALRAPGEQPER
jgi:predicted short-subunit dehydrogenase-like oxidoreductase (DUF2520 family)